MNLYEIGNALRNQEKAVFSLNEIARIIGFKKEVAAVYVYRMLKKNLLFKIEKNKLSTSSDPFIIASQIAAPSYLSLTTALYLHSMIEQVVDKLYVLTTRKKMKISVFGTEVYFIKSSPKAMFGYKREKKESSFIMLASLEKTIIDCLIFQKYCPISYLIKALKKADIRKLEEFALILNKEVLNRRLGYLLELIGRKSSLKRRTKTSYKLNSNKMNRGRFNKKWYLYVNEEILC